MYCFHHSRFLGEKAQMFTNIRCSQVVRSIVLTLFFFGLVALPQGAYSAPGKKSASKKAVSKESPAKKAQEAQQKASENSASTQPAAHAGGNEENDPNLPAFFPANIHKQPYFHSR